MSRERIVPKRRTLRLEGSLRHYLSQIMFLLSLFYFLSRLPFLRNYPVFYDSFEYAKLAEKLEITNFSAVANSSHNPIHTFYFLAILIFKKIFFFFSASTNMVLVSLIFGYLTVIFFYLFVKKCVNQKTAFFASLLLLAFPYFFAANTNILYESEQLFFQIISLYLFSSGLKEDRVIKIIFSGLFFGMAISLSVGSLIIFPVFILLFWEDKSAKNLKLFFLFLLISVLSPIILDLLFLQAPWQITQKYRPRLHELTSSAGGLPIFTFRVLRNITFGSAAILSLPGAVLTFAGLVIIFVKNRKRAIAYLVWLIPNFFLMQYWHMGLYGRLGIFIIFPSSLILAETFSQKLPRILLCLLLCLCLIPTALAQRQKPAIYRFYSLIEDLDKSKFALITSDYMRFLYQKNNFNLYIVGPDDDPLPVEKFIKENLGKGKMVLIDSQGLNYPYLQFDGDPFQILSRKNKPNRLSPLWEKFQTEVFRTDPKNPNIYFLQVRNNDLVLLKLLPREKK